MTQTSLTCWALATQHMTNTTQYHEIPGIRLSLNQRPTQEAAPRIYILQKEKGGEQSQTSAVELSLGLAPRGSQADPPPGSWGHQSRGASGPPWPAAASCLKVSVTEVFAREHRHHTTQHEET
eukprot:1157626-Pelagomonas_calceolata.AAC.29